MSDGDETNPVDEGLQHLEAAARELIQAGRSFLDAVESSLGRPGAVEDLWSAVRNAAGGSAGASSAEPAPDSYETIDIEREPPAGQ